MRMMDLFNDVINVFASFGLVDYILYISVVTLIILVVSLIYVMKNEKEMLEEKSVEEVKEQMNEPTVLNEELNLRDIVSTIDENPKPLIDMTAYEEEQEQKAIISYDELIRDVNNKSISYDKEELVDDVIPVKRIQMNMELPKRKETIIQDLNLTQKEPKIEIEPIQSTSKLFSYEKEEAFLKALKELNELLN